MEIETRAYSKINLHLEVLNKRTDGYHNIFSLMASLQLYDLLKLENISLDNSGNISVEIINSGGAHGSIIDSISPGENLITKAAYNYLRKCGKSGKIVFNIQKNIPAGAGLGGGSSDAAAVLRLLNANLSIFTESELLMIGAETGADVPFCISGGYAICEGIGEKIINLEGSLDYWVLVANDGIHINTGNSYNRLNRSQVNNYDFGPIDRKRDIFAKGLKSGNIHHFSSELKNDFEKFTMSDYPAIRKIKEGILSFSPDFSIMTGTGSSVIGLFEDYTRANKAKAVLERNIKEVILTRFI